MRLALMLLSFAPALLAAEPCQPSAEALATFLKTAPKATADAPGLPPADFRKAVTLLENVTGTPAATSDALAKAQGSLEASLDADVSGLLDSEHCAMTDVYTVAARALESVRTGKIPDGERAKLRAVLRRWLMAAPDRRLEAFDLMARIATIEKMHKAGFDPLPAEAWHAFERIRGDAEDARRLSVMSAEEWGRNPSRTAYRALEPAARRKLNRKWLDELRAEDALRQRLAAVVGAFGTRPRRRE